jgi:hypothetical protein
MAFKNMTAEEMVEISGAWTSTDNAAHSMMKSVARLSGMLPDVQTAHAALVALIPKNDPRFAQIGRLASEADALHDLLARGIYGFLSEAAQLVEDGHELLSLRDALMPEGLSPVIHATYRGQAGYAKLLRERLDAATKDSLRAVLLPDSSNLLDRVQAWLDAADRVGKLEEERARMETGGPALGAHVVNARNQWVRTVNALVAVAALAELDAETDRIVFGPLRDAEAKADARSARRSAGAETEEKTETAAPAAPTA